MTYFRVIPRDLFNEADLLKCYGRLWILLDQTRGHKATLGKVTNGIDPGEHSGETFQIVQDSNDGSLTIANVPFRIAGKRFALSRPLNSRDHWPLWVEDEAGDICEPVFTDEGELSPEFLKLLEGVEL